MEAVKRALRDYRLSLGVSGKEVEFGEYSEVNQKQQPRERESDELSLTDISEKPNFVIGNEVSLSLFLSLKDPKHYRRCSTYHQTLGTKSANPSETADCTSLPPTLSPRS